MCCCNEIKTCYECGAVASFYSKGDPGPYDEGDSGPFEEESWWCFNHQKYDSVEVSNED